MPPPVSFGKTASGALPGSARPGASSLLGSQFGASLGNRQKTTLTSRPPSIGRSKPEPAAIAQLSPQVEADFHNLSAQVKDGKQVELSPEQFQQFQQFVAAHRFRTEFASLIELAKKMKLAD